MPTSTPIGFLSFVFSPPFIPPVHSLCSQPPNAVAFFNLVLQFPCASVPLLFLFPFNRQQIFFFLTFPRPPKPFLGSSSLYVFCVPPLCPSQAEFHLKQSTLFASCVGRAPKSRGGAGFSLELRWASGKVLTCVNGAN